MTVRAKGKIFEQAAASATVEEILVAEDDPAVQRVLKHLLESHGFAVEITSDGKSALEAAQAGSPSALILDLHLPTMSGIDVCRQIRKTSTLPIVVLSAVTETADKILLLELGADDYVTKPFSPRELLARVQAAIRRGRRRDVTNFGTICVDFGRMEATREGQRVSLSLKEAKLLKFFLKNAERAVSREDILANVFSYGSYPSAQMLNSYVCHLREKLERDPYSPVHFLTVRNVGYKFMP